jgi:flagellar biosynthesis regulator FlbT
MIESMFSHSQLKPLIEYEGRSFTTSRQWHEQVQPTAELRLTNRSIRSMETYQKLVDEGHIVEVSNNTTDPFLGSLIKANSYNPIMLIDPVAQKAIEHHFKQTAQNALMSSKESAALGLAGIRMDLIAEDPQMMMWLQTISRQKELERRQTELERAVPKMIEEAAQKMSGHAGYFTVLAYANTLSVRLSSDTARTAGKKAAELCRELGYEIGKVSDERFGKINAYPEEVLRVVFQELDK